MKIINSSGGYAYGPGSSFASTGVVALPGVTMVRAVFDQPLPLSEGFRAIERHLAREERPLAALCGVELRMTEVLGLEPFQAFNRAYLAQLGAWGVLIDGACPLARTNVVPRPGSLASDAVSAFSYTTPTRGSAPAFVFSGLPELPEGSTYPRDTVRRGEDSADALLEKTICAVDGVLGRARALGATWDAAASVHLYSRQPLGQVLRRDVLARLGIVPAQGIIWHDTAPPVVELELEVDIRRYARELHLAAD
ncbi:2-amino-5-chloromuconate deaminase CnbZ [Phenylobacterium sp.]|uniref:2-amino-5-chloromuconate deaminase CnbZ n=1 Tax=Phenylobacterium sp. TaxID=1871053 RepID=UPI002FC59DA5